MSRQLGENKEDEAVIRFILFWENWRIGLLVFDEWGYDIECTDGDDSLNLVWDGAGEVRCG